MALPVTAGVRWPAEGPGEPVSAPAADDRNSLGGNSQVSESAARRTKIRRSFWPGIRVLNKTHVSFCAKRGPMQDSLAAALV